jgi:hypothetical protein
MLPDWCKPIIKTLTGNKVQGAPHPVHHVIPGADPSGASPAAMHGHIGAGKVQISQAAYNYTAAAPAAHHGILGGVPMWAKKAAIIGTACATPPLMLTAFASSTPAPPVLPTPGIPAASPTQVPEPSGILLMPFGVVAIVAAAKLGRRRANEPTAS